MGIKSCCFCFDLKHGTNASATFTLVTRIIGIIALSAILIVVHQEHGSHWKRYPKDSNPRLYEHDENFQFNITRNEWESKPTFDLSQLLEIFVGIGIGICALVASFSIMLIIGTQKRIKCLFWPWMIFTGLEITGSIVFFIKCLIIMGYCLIYYAIGALVGAIFNSYMLWCVIAYYKSLSSNIQYQHFAVKNSQVSFDNLSPSKNEKDATPVV